MNLNAGTVMLQSLRLSLESTCQDILICSFFPIMYQRQHIRTRMSADDGAEHGDLYLKFRMFFQNHIPKNSGAADFHGFANRICEGTEQIRDKK